MRLIMGFLSSVFVFCSAILFGIALSLVAHFIAEISLSNFPYILVGASLSLIALAYATFISSFSFYRMQVATGLVMGLILMMCLGGFLYGSGHAERWERKFQKNAFYRKTLPAIMIDAEYADNDNDADDM